MNTDPYILVLGGSDDGQTACVVEMLQRRGQPVVFLDYAKPRDLCVVVLRDGQRLLSIDGVQRSDPTLVWSRLKISGLLGHWSRETVESVFLPRAEWRGLLTNISHLYADRSVYRLSAAAEAEAKLKQFAAAAKAGFTIPFSSMSLGKTFAEDAVARCEPLVAKPIQARNIPAMAGDVDEYRVTMTMAVDAQTIHEADPSDFAIAPLFLQERICTGTEYRVLGFRKKSFCYRDIFSVETRKRPDERVLLGGERNGKPIIGANLKATPSWPEIERMVSTFLSEMDLEYGAFDIIVTPDGQHIFLECNPEGQWCAANRSNLNDVAAHFAGVIIDHFNHRLARASVA